MGTLDILRAMAQQAVTLAAEVDAAAGTAQSARVLVSTRRWLAAIEVYREQLTQREIEIKP